MNRMRFIDKVVIVTGGASGIGEATVWAFAREGAKVVIADFADVGQDLADKLNDKGYPAIFVKVDVSSEVDTQKMVDETVSHFGQIDVLFANAGIGEGGCHRVWGCFACCCPPWFRPENPAGCAAIR